MDKQVISRVQQSLEEALECLAGIYHSTRAEWTYEQSQPLIRAMSLISEVLGELRGGEDSSPLFD
jgi:hypothetical protein